MTLKESEINKIERELARFKAEIDEGVDYAQKSGKASFIYIQTSSKLAILRIICDGRGNNSHFAAVIPRSTARLSDVTFPNTPEGINDPNKPWEMLLEANTVSPYETLTSLPSFLYGYYDKIYALPINLYRSRKSFIEKNKFASLSPDNLLTLEAA